MTDQVITIVPIGEIENDIIEHIRIVISNIFNFSTDTKSVVSIFPDFPIPLYSNRYNSTQVLKYISKRIPQDTEKLLVITDSDLYSPIFSSFFGEAQLKGKCAIVSLHRLKQEYYNLASNQNIFFSRFEKVIIHELAHTFGMLHCDDKNCVMFPSHNIIDTDVKSNSFCETCIQELC